MSLEDTIFSYSLGGMLLGLVLYVVFGQITVRRLRKKLNTKAALGMELLSGWDIYNAAQALSLPRSLTRRLEAGPLSALHAKAECLRKNTTAFDRMLAFLFYWLFTVSGLVLIMLVALNGLGIF